MSARSRPWSAAVRLTVLLLLAAAAALVLLRAGPLSWPAFVGLCLAFLAAAAVVLAAGSVSPFGPVFFADAVRTARRGRYAFLRCLVLAALLVVLLVLYLLVFGGFEGLFGSVKLPPHKMAEFALAFFECVTAVQLVTVAVVTPSLTAAAISEEREKKTLDFLLSSCLSGPEIVLGKLASRLGGAALLVLTPLPLLSLLPLLGGVDPNLVIAGFAVTALSMLSLGGLSLALSVYVNRTLGAFLLTDLLAGSYLVASTALHAWRALPPAWDDALCAGNVVVAYWKLAPGGGAWGGGLVRDLPGLLAAFALFHLGVTAACVLAALPLRALAKAAASRGLRRAYVVGVTQRRRRLPAVGGSPMMWKELHAEPAFRFNRTVMVLVSTFVTLALILGCAVLVMGLVLTFSLSTYSPTEGMNKLVRGLGTFFGCLLLVGVGLRAAGSVGGERDRQTLEGLLATPLGDREILRAKWWGAFAGGRKLWWFLAVVWLAGLVSGGLHPAALVAVAGGWCVLAAFLASAGLWLSLNCKTTGRATALMLLLMVALAIGPWLVGWVFDVVMRRIGNYPQWGTSSSSAGALVLAWAVLPVPPLVFWFITLPLWKKKKGRGFWSPLTAFLLCLTPSAVVTLLALPGLIMGNPTYSSMSWTSTYGSGTWPPDFGQQLGLALSPPSNLWCLAFYAADRRPPWADDFLDPDFAYERRFLLNLMSAGIGLACYSVAAFVLWGATCRRFPQVTGRMEQRGTPVRPVEVRGRGEGLSTEY